MPAALQPHGAQSGRGANALYLGAETSYAPGVEAAGAADKVERKEPA
jgi:hypothetical protein